MNRIELLSELVQCSCEDNSHSIELIFGRLVHEFKSLYVFYDIIKELDLKIKRFHMPIIEGSEVTYQFENLNEQTLLSGIHGKRYQYKKSNIEFRITTHLAKKSNLVSLSLTQVLK